jgi:hypothetical protein
VKTNKEEAEKLAQQAAQWTEDLAHAIDDVKADTAELERLRPDVTPIRECVSLFLCLWDVNNSHSVLGTIAKAMELHTKQSLPRRLMDSSKNKEELTELRSELKGAYIRFMACYFKYELTSLILQCSSLPRYERKVHFRSSSLTPTLVRFIYPNLLNQTPEPPRRETQQTEPNLLCTPRLPRVSVRLSPRHSSGDPCQYAGLGRKAT